LNASAQSITDQQVQDIQEYQDENGYEDLSEMAWDLETIVEGYEPFNTNMWVIDKPLDNDGLSFIITDENDQEVTTFKLDEMTDHYEIDENYESIDYHGYPSEGENENVLLFMEENKGVVYGFNFESEEAPTPADFSYIPGTIGTDYGDYDFIDKVFFKGSELEVDHNFQATNGKGVTVQLFTIND
jgi:hypothetical protein